MAKTSYHAAARGVLDTAKGKLTYYRLDHLDKAGAVKLDRLPFSMRVMLENALRNEDGHLVTADDVETALKWDAKSPPRREFPFMPGRVILQDFTGVPAIVDLAAMRSAMVKMGGDPKRINPLIPADLVIDHSVQVDYFGSADAFAKNVDLEYQRNQERYAFLRWAQRAFQDFRVVPPGTGIVHQVNLEYLASVVATRKDKDGATVAFPDTLVGTDSHTTMINGLGVLGWGAGGIEAEAVLLGQPYYMLLPEVIGFKLTGQLREGVTATDLVLTVTQMLRAKGVVEKFVEFFGPGLARLPLADRATIANMAPEYGATVGFFPIDDETLAYLRGTGRDSAQVDLVERYAKAQHLFFSPNAPEPAYTDTLALDMGTVEPSMAGPKRPQDRLSLSQVKGNFAANYKDPPKKVEVSINGQKAQMEQGAVVITAITSCTNTSNPSVMIGAGLVAKKAVEHGLKVKPWVKTSLAPGSRVVADYLQASGLVPSLESLGFQIVGYGCTTCIGNSGPLPEPVAQAVEKNDLVVAAVISGNRNFEGRVHPQVKANYLASPMLVVAYALAGTVNVDLSKDPIGAGKDGRPVYLKDIWPTQAEVKQAVSSSLNPELFRHRYGQVFAGDARWQGLPVPTGDLYEWDAKSTYIQHAPYFRDMPKDPLPLRDIQNARVLVSLGDSVTTDHISPAGNISAKGPAGQYLISLGVQPADFNSFGARRGNHHVMKRGTFANVRLKNKLTPDTEGDWTVHLPGNEKLRIYDASVRYQQAGVPLIVLAGKEYGAGSSRDWAAKGPNLLGIKAAIAESYERIHRSNLIGMGMLPLQYKAGQSAASLGLTGRETYSISGIANVKPGADATVTAVADDGKRTTFAATVRLDTPVEVDYYRNGGVLQTVLRQMVK